MTNLELKEISTLINDYDLFLFDMWGVIIDSEQPYKGVIEVVNKVMKTNKVFFVSNAPRPASKISDNLYKWGVGEVKEEMVITSGDISRGIINQLGLKLGHPPAVYHLGADRNDDLLSNLSHTTASTLLAADVLLISLFRDEHENLNEFDDFLKEAAKLNVLSICANPDNTIPNLGSLRYCAGYFAEKLQGFGGNVFYAGKPGINIYEEVFSKAPTINKNRILMIGDTFETDILGGNNAGIHTALVMSGNAEKFHKNFVTIEDKIKALHSSSIKAGAIPTLITKLT